MRRDRVNKHKYPLMGFVNIKGEWQRFDCNMRKQRMITTDIGQHTVASGYVIKTPSTLDFRNNYEMTIDDQEFTIDSVDSEIDESHGGRFRGKPRWIVRMEVS